MLALNGVAVTYANGTQALKTTTLTVNRRRNGTPYRLPKGTPASSCIGSARVGPGLSI